MLFPNVLSPLWESQSIVEIDARHLAGSTRFKKDQKKKITIAVNKIGKTRK